MKRKQTAADLLLPKHLAELDIFVKREVRVCKEWRWRFDFAERVKPKHRPQIACEIDGGLWIQGRHSRGAGRQSDMDKINTALTLGFCVFVFSPQDVLSGKAKEFIRLWLDRQGG